MTSGEYRQLIIKATGDNDFQLSNEDFQLFVDTAHTFGTAKPVLENWNKFVKDGNTSIKEFIDYMIDVWLEVKG
jgi:archaellum component FlaG (FlaF/FlaG flagellin family)